MHPIQEHPCFCVEDPETYGAWQLAAPKQYIYLLSYHIMPTAKKHAKHNNVQQRGGGGETW